MATPRKDYSAPLTRTEAKTHKRLKTEPGGLAGAAGVMGPMYNGGKRAVVASTVKSSPTKRKTNGLMGDAKMGGGSPGHGKMRSVQLGPAKTKKGVTTSKHAFVPAGQSRRTKK